MRKFSVAFHKHFRENAKCFIAATINCSKELVEFSALIFNEFSLNFCNLLLKILGFSGNFRFFWLPDFYFFAKFSHYFYPEIFALLFNEIFVFSAFFREIFAFSILQKFSHFIATERNAKMKRFFFFAGNSTHTTNAFTIKLNIN